MERRTRKLSSRPGEVKEEEDESRPAEVVLSNKGGPKVIHDGYMYTLHKKQPYNIRWRCVGRSFYCRGSLVTTIDCKNPRLHMEHNHRPDYSAANSARKRYIALGKPPILDMDEYTKGKKKKAQPGNVNTDLKNENTTEDNLPSLVPTTVSEPPPLIPSNVPKIQTGKTTLALNLDQEKSMSTKNVDRLIEKTSTVKKSTTEKVEDFAMKQEPEDDDDILLEEGMQPSSPGISSYRVRSHSRSLRAMANPSAVWAHFDLCTNDPLRAQCRICGAVVVRGGANPRQCGTTNLHRHLRVHHGGRLIGRRYHVMQVQQRDKTSASSKAMRMSSLQTSLKQVRNIAPANLPASSGNPQSQQQPKTLVLKTIPLKVKQVAPTTIKMPPRQIAQGIPQNTIPQQAAEVCLRWNSYHSNMQNSFPSLLDTEQFVDVTLACEGRSLKCHKMILSSCSDYLAELLRENPCQHPIILMKDLKFWEVEALVKFMYRGEVNVAHEKLPQLLNAAEALQVKGLASSPSSPNSRPPLLLPQAKQGAQPFTRVAPEAKENKPSTSSGAATVPSSPKRTQKRQMFESTESRPFTKIRLQRPSPPASPTATVKLEPLDIPVSPTEMFSDNNLMGLHEEEDPGGSVQDSEDQEMSFGNMDGPPDLTDGEDQDQMEFVPTDFLEQEQDIVEDLEPDSSIGDREESRKSYNSEDCEDDEMNEKKMKADSERLNVKGTEKPPTEKLVGPTKDKTL